MIQIRNNDIESNAKKFRRKKTKIKNVIKKTKGLNISQIKTLTFFLPLFSPYKDYDKHCVYIPFEMLKMGLDTFTDT